MEYPPVQLMEATPELRELIHTPHPAATVANSHSEKASRKLSPSPEEKYDPRKRDPQYAHAESTCLWELVRIYLRSLELARLEY
jgi:ribosome biogenesis protein MAK21